MSVNKLPRNSPLTFTDKVILYVHVFGLLATSGIPFLMGRKWVLVYFAYSVFCLAYYYHRVQLAHYFVPALFFGIVQLLQLVYFGFSFFIGTVGLQIIFFLSGLFAAEVLRERFFDIFIRIMLFFSLISIVLFLPILVNFSFTDLLVNKFPISYQTEMHSLSGELVYNRSIFFLNFPPNFNLRVRNSGPFWEPGAFGGYLMLAFMINIFRGKALLSKQNIIFLVAIITTFSTTAYLALGIFLIGYYGIAIKSNVGRIAFLAIGIFGFVFLFGELDFLKDKIYEQIKDTQYQVDSKGGDSRFASAYLDLKELDDSRFYYFAGRGSHPDTRIGTSDKNTIRTNGMTDHLVRWGIPFFLFYIICFRKSLGKICELYGIEAKHSWLALFVICLLNTSEVYFIFSFFWMFFFFYIALRNTGSEDSV